MASFFVPVFFVLVQILVLLVPILVVGGALRLLLRYVRAVERRGVDQGDGPAALRERLQRLEEECGRAEERIERLEEGQQFMQRLLMERSSGTPPTS